MCCALAIQQLHQRPLCTALHVFSLRHTIDWDRFLFSFLQTVSVHCASIVGLFTIVQLSGEKFSNEMSMLSSNFDLCDSSPENYFILASKLQTITISHYSTAIVFGCWSETNGCDDYIQSRELCHQKDKQHTKSAASLIQTKFMLWSKFMLQFLIVVNYI